MDSIKSKDNNPARSKAEESAHIKKARGKLAKQLAKTEITPSALEHSRALIRLHFSRNSQDKERIPLTADKGFELFDSNKHPEPVHSKYVRKLLRELQSSKRTTTELNFKAKKLEAPE